MLITAITVIQGGAVGKNWYVPIYCYSILKKNPIENKSLLYRHGRIQEGVG